MMLGHDKAHLNDDSNNSDITNDEDDEFGDSIGFKNKRRLCVCQLNVNGIPESSTAMKNNQLRQAINEHSIDIIRISETNKCWHLLDDDDR